MWTLLQTGEDGWATPSLGLFVSFGFTLLQFYWGGLLFRQILKMVRGGKGKPETTAAEHDYVKAEQL